MAIRTNIYTVDWSVSPRVIWIDISQTEGNVQDLYDTIKHYEAIYDGIDEPILGDAGGSEPLSDILFNTITVSLFNAVYAFADRPGPDWVICDMKGGNIVSFTDESRTTALYPRMPTAYVSADRTASSSGTLITTAGDAAKSYMLSEAGDILITLGAIESGDYTDTQTHDESYLEISETSTGFNVDFIFTAEADDIPRTFQFQGRYQGNPSHVVRLQAYNHETSTYEYLTAVSGSNQLESSTTDYFKEFILNGNHINPATNEIIIKIIHSSPGSTSHRLWIDKVNIVTGLTSSGGSLTPEQAAQLDAIYNSTELKLLTKALWLALK